LAGLLIRRIAFPVILQVVFRLNHDLHVLDERELQVRKHLRHLVRHTLTVQLWVVVVTLHFPALAAIDFLEVPREQIIGRFGHPVLHARTVKDSSFGASQGNWDFLAFDWRQVDLFQVNGPLAGFAGNRSPDNCLVDIFVLGVGKAIKLPNKVVVVAAKPDP